jgi:hypothetical protein
VEEEETLVDVKKHTFPSCPALNFIELAFLVRVDNIGCGTGHHQAAIIQSQKVLLLKREIVDVSLKQQYEERRA